MSKEVKLPGLKLHVSGNGRPLALSIPAPQAKINESIADDIRADYAAGNITYRKLAKKYKLASSSISNVINYKTWKRV